MWTTKSLTVLLLFSLSVLFSQEKIEKLKLISGKKSKTIYPNRVLRIYGPGMEFSGTFQFRNDSSLFLEPFTQDINGEVKFFDEKTTERLPINFTNIEKIEYERSTLGTVSALAFWASLGTAFIVSPLVSIKKGGGFDTEKFLTISGISLGTAVISAGVIVVFGDRTFYLKANSKNRRIWTFEK